MWRTSQPDESELAAFHRAAVQSPLSYPEVGATARLEPVRGYDNDRTYAQIGAGETAFHQACAAIREWRMIEPDWVRYRSPVGQVVGQTVVLSARAFGLWWVNACRVVYVVNDDGATRRYGFAYGTLERHVEKGEELFCVELLPNGEVWYEIKAFSTPRYWMTRLAYPFARRLQRRFVRESFAAMRSVAALE